MKNNIYKKIVFIFGFLFLISIAQPINAAIEIEDVKFTPQIGIPGSEFQQGKAVEVGGVSVKGENKVLTANLISRYVNSFYSWGLSILGILAVLILMTGGILWLTSRGDNGQIEKAKKMISGSLFGSLLLLGAWFILNTINPDLVKPASIEITTINKKSIDTSDFLDEAEKFKFVCLSGSLTCANTTPPTVNVDIQACYDKYGSHDCKYPEKAWCCGLNSDSEEKANALCVGKQNGTPCQINETALMGTGYCSNNVCKPCIYFGKECDNNYECLGASLLICGYGETSGVEYASDCNSGYCAGRTEENEGGSCGPNFEGRCYSYTGIYSCPQDTKAYSGGTQCGKGLKCCIRTSTGVTGNW